MIDVRIASGPDDYAAAAELRWRWDAEHDAEPAFDHDEYVAQTIGWALEHRSTHSCFLAEEDGHVLGMAWLAVTARVPTPRSVRRTTADVQSVYVVPARRSDGVGRLLLDALLAEASLLGVERVVVHSSPRAVPFYARRGFANDGTLFDLRPEAPARAVRPEAEARTPESS